MAEAEQGEQGKAPQAEGGRGVGGGQGGGGAVVAELLRGRAELAARVASLPAAGAGAGELVVLAHGLAGTAEDLAYLKRALLAQQRPDAPIIVLNAGCNEAETRDGVAAGGRRLAAEIVSAVAGAGGGVGRVSLVGNSLGGLYARYAAALLFDPEHGRVCGVEAGALVTTASPHLGVRSFTYLPVPDQLHGLGSVVVGATGEDLFLAAPRSGRRELPLLAQMALNEELFLAPLKAFRRRRAYANLGGDFLVPFGTAAFTVGADGGAGWGLLEAGAAQRFLAAAQPLPLPPAAPASSPAAPAIALAELLVPPAPSPPDPAPFASLEQAMAAGLDSCGWSKVGVRFTSLAAALLPLSHNKICALEGGGWLRAPLKWLWEEGRGVMDELAAFLLADPAPAPPTKHSGPSSPR